MRKIYFLLLTVLFVALTTITSHSQTAFITTGTPGTPAYNAGPVYRSSAASTFDASRYSYLYTASELSAAGITSGSVISLVGWVKNNTATSLGAGGIFRIYMKNTSTADFSLATETWANLNSGATMVYENLTQVIPATATPDYIDFPLTTNFVYTGGSLEISTEWDINQVAGNPSTGTFDWLWSTVNDRIYGTGNTTLAPITSLSSTTNSISTIDNRRPFIKITYSGGTTGIDVGAQSLVAPAVSPNNCYTSTEPVTVQIRNFSTNPIDFSVNPVTVTTNVTGAVTQTLTGTVNTGILAPVATLNVPMSATLNMSTTGVYTFNATAVVTGDVTPSNNAMPPAAITKAVLAPGTASASPNQLCLTGTPTLSTAGATGYGGLQWQQSTTSGSGFTDIPGATTNPFTLGSAITQTMYYRLIVNCNGNTATSNEATVTVNSPQITSTTPGASCGPGPVAVSLAATGTGTVLNWYDVPTGGVPIGTGSPFTTPPISVNTPYYVSASSGGGTTNVGLPARITATSTGIGTTNFGLVFDALTPFTLNSVVLYPIAAAASTAGTVTIDVVNSTGAVLHTATVNVIGNPAPSTAQTVSLNFNIQAGTNLKLRHSARSAGITALLFEPSATAPSGGNYGYPFVVPGVLSINHSTLTAPPTNTARLDLYYYFYNWAIVTGCESARTPVLASVTPPPSATIFYAGSPYCSNAGTAGVVQTGTGGGTYSSTAGLSINPTTGGVTLGTSTPGPYTVTYTIPASGGCPPFTTTANITVNNCGISNNECATATVLTSGTTCVNTAGTNVGATQSIASITCGIFTSSSALDVWYQFTAVATSHTVTVAGGAGFDAIIDVRSGACNGTNIGCADATVSGGTEVVALGGLTIGNVYLVRVYGWAGGTGTFNICVTHAASGPANDICATATVLTSGTTCVNTAGTNVGATQSIASITCGIFTSSSALDVWYQFTAVATSHTVTVAGGAGFDAIIDVRSGACNGTNIGCADATVSGGTEVVALGGLTIGNVYLVRVYGWAGGTGTFNICVTHAAAPPCNCTITGSNSVCSGTTGISYSGPAGMATYAWSITGNGTITSATNIQTIAVTAGASGSYTLSLTTTNAGCTSSTCTMVVTVNPTPSAGVGQMQVIITGNGDWADEITWTLTNSLSTVILSGGPYGFNPPPTASPLVPANNAPFSFFIEAAGGPFFDNSALWEVRCNGVVVASGCIRGTASVASCTTVGTSTTNNISGCGSNLGAQTICSGSAITPITLSGPVAGTVYNWTRNNTVAVTGIPANGTGNISGTLTNTTNAPVVVTFSITPTANGCNGPVVTVPVTVNPIPNAVATPASQTICSGPITTIVLTSAVAGTTYAWTRNNTVAVTGIPANGTGNISGSLTNTTLVQQTVTFTITPTANGCVGTPITATVTLDVAPTIVCPASITLASTVGGCTAVATYAPTVTGSPAPTLTYTKTGATTASGSGSGSGTSFNVGVTTVTITATNGCGTASCSFTVTVTDSQLPTISSQPANATRCVGQTATFSVTAATAPSAGGPIAYQWQQWNGSAWVNIAGATTSTLTVSNVTYAMNTNTYRVVLTGLCSIVNSSAATLSVNPVPTVIVSANPASILPNQTTTLTATSNPSGGTHQWFYNGTAIPGATGVSYGPIGVDELGSYRVVYTSPAGCVATSADFEVTGAISDVLWVYPNPNRGQFQVRFYNDSNEPATIIVLNAKGQKVYERKVTTGNTTYSQIEVDLGLKANGIYIVQLFRASGRLMGVRRVMVQSF